MTKAEYLKQCRPYGLPCRDCGGTNQGYMVDWGLWKKYAGDLKCSSYTRNKDTDQLERDPNTGNFVCVACFEKRLGRDLTVQDFTDAPINFGVFGGFDCETYCKLPKEEVA